MILKLKEINYNFVDTSLLLATVGNPIIYFILANAKIILFQYDHKTF